MRRKSHKRSRRLANRQARVCCPNCGNETTIRQRWFECSCGHAGPLQALNLTTISLSNTALGSGSVTALGSVVRI